MIPTVTACNTCRAAFPNTDKLKVHYRGEWHAFNSKRRASELAPLALKEYAVYISSKNKESGGPAARRPAAKDAAASRAPKEDPVTRRSAPPVEKERLPAPAPQAAPIQSAASTGIMKETQPALPPPVPEDEDQVEDEDAWTDASGEEGDEFPEEMDEAALLRHNIAPHISIFDDKIFADAVSCVSYMELNFGFFIPDVECLTDLPGLLLYLGQKVKLGGICLYCQKLYEPGRACQNHMMSKSHCKVAYEEDLDLEEYDQFYDYDLASDNDTDDEELEVSAIGELMLSSGKTVGHRSYAKYYKQNFRKEESRPSVLALKREEVARLGHIYGSGVTQLDEKSLMRLSDAAVAGVLAKQRREVLKVTKMQQRAEQRFLFRTRKVVEYKSTVDKLRSHATTTDRIRDYHGTLK